jgi:hypothetical protein
VSRFLATLCLVASAFLAGCPCPPPTQFEAWHFENDCANETCGFNVTRGSATRADALVAGEHSLHMTSGTQMDQQLMEQVPTAQLNQPFTVSVVARCEHRSSVQFTMVVSETRASGDAAFAIPTLRTIHGVIAPTEHWNTHTATLGTMSIQSGDAGAVTSATIVSLQVDVDPLGDCWIDELSLARGRNWCG